MPKQPLITIPTYWTRKCHEKHAGDSYFDHPTALDCSETLTRTLSSLAKVKGKFSLALIVGTVAYDDDELNQKAIERVRYLAEPFQKRFPILVFGKGDVERLISHLKGKDLSTGFLNDLRPKEYSSIRNVQLIVTKILGHEVMVGLDDDELFKPGYLQDATRFIGKRGVYGIGGFYKDRKGHYVIDDFPEPKTGNLFSRKYWLRNKGFLEAKNAKSRLTRANFVFGGNMVIHQEMFEKVCFDIGIPRGEDIDYLINARMEGMDFYFDNKLFITHKPPMLRKGMMAPHLRTGAFSMANYHKMLQDISRFIYQKEKLRVWNAGNPGKKVTKESLGPYPGAYLSERIYDDAAYAIEYQYPEEVETFHVDARKEVSMMKASAKKNVPRYFTFAKEWKKLMGIITKDAGIIGLLQRQPFTQTSAS